MQRRLPADKRDDEACADNYGGVRQFGNKVTGCMEPTPSLVKRLDQDQSAAMDIGGSAAVTCSIKSGRRSEFTLALLICPNLGLELLHDSLVHPLASGS